MARIGIWGCVILALSVSAARGQMHGYEALLNWNGLPLAKSELTAGAATSYDPGGTNQDYNHYELPEGLQTGDVQTVVKTLTGRTWPAADASGG